MKPASLFLTGLLAASLPLHGADYQKHAHEPVDLAHDKNLYVVGYAHLDTQWRWTYVDTIEKDIRNTMEQNFPLLEKYPNYIFNFTGSRRYEFMKEYYPEDYEKVKKYVAEGRWVPAGSSVDECDVNTPSLESLERHFLYGNHFFQREFGKQSTDFLLPDCFGFPASIPTVMAHGGLKGFSTQKLTWGSAVGIPFNVGVWIGPDGSRMPAALNPGGYGTAVTEDLSSSPTWLKRIDVTGESSGVFADFHYFGIGDQGGAPKASSVDWLERSVAGKGPIRVVEGSADQLFRDLTPEQAAKLPTYKGELELVNHSAGSITSEAYMKRWNRKNEQLAAAAEGAATAASWLGAFPYPYTPLYNAWDLVLGSQMHDIMPGTSIPKAYEYSWNDEVLALNQFAAVTERASAAVVAQLDTRGPGTPVAVYNPLAIEREDPVEALIPMKGSAAARVTAIDPEGHAVPAQILSQEGENVRVLFLAKVPSAGYAVFHLQPAPVDELTSTTTLKVTDHSLENARYRVSLNAAGDIASIFDKSLRRELLSAPARLSIHTENPAHYPAWNMDWEDRQVPARSFVSGTPSIRITEHGPARVALEVRRTTENSTFTQEIRLAAGMAGDRVEILHRIDWRTQQASLRADFPFSAANPEASFEDKVGVVRRGTDNPKAFELAQQQWMDLTDKGGSYGVTVLNDSKYGSDKPDDHTLRSTMIYTPGTRGGTPDQGTQDLGRHEILLGLAAHQGDWAQGRTPWQAARLNQPLRAFLPEAHEGAMGKTFSLMSLDSDQVQIAAIKKAEDSDEIIVRFKELTGQPAANLALHCVSAITSAREVNGQEQPMGEAVIKDGALAFDMKGFGLRAFALKLAPPAAPTAPVASQAVALAYDSDVVSSRAKRDDGAMDAAGGAYPAELFPAKLQREGVDFTLGPVADGAKNALAARGQHIDLPSGSFNRVHILAAANGDADGEIKIGETTLPFQVPNWTGYIGQWDNRLWEPGFTGGFFTENNKFTPIGMAPGYIKRTPVAWFATHHNSPDGDAYYQYSYLFQLSYDLPAGAKDLGLPNDPKIRIFAISVSREASAAPAAAPLYDTLADHQANSAPIVTQAGQTFTDATQIALLPPLYYRPHQLHYTLDGSDPTASSPVYESPFFASDTVQVAARQIDENGKAGPVVRGTVTIHDQTPPALVSSMVDRGANALELGFNEPLASAVEAGICTVQPAVPISKITRLPEGQKLMITFGAPLTPGTAYTMALKGIKDASPAGNVMPPKTVPFNADNIVYTLPAAELPKEAASHAVFGLPVSSHDHWTMNLLVKPAAEQKDRILLAGFGQTEQPTGRSTVDRYLALFKDGIHFWDQGKDIDTYSPLDPGQWQMLTASYDGDSLSLYKDGELIGKTRVGFTGDAEGAVSVGPVDPWEHAHSFSGSIRDFTIRRGDLSDKEVKKLFEDHKTPQ